MKKESELDHLIFPEIINDELYYDLQDIASKLEVKNILEIGSSTGEGSTKALYTGMKDNPLSRLFCLEISRPRFAKLWGRYSNFKNVFCLNMSSVSVKDFLAENLVAHFYFNQKTNLNKYQINQVLGWLYQDIEYITKEKIPEEGIEFIKWKFGIKFFDVVLIDGSAFTGQAELDRVYGAKYIILDDINDIKNFHNNNRLSKDTSYKLIVTNLKLRNGFSIFKKVL